MSEREKTTRDPDRAGEGGRRAASEELAPAEGQQESLKVHGDKLEKLIPREQGKGE